MKCLVFKVNDVISRKHFRNVSFYFVYQWTPISFTFFTCVFAAVVACALVNSTAEDCALSCCSFFHFFFWILGSRLTIITHKHKAYTGLGEVRISCALMFYTVLSYKLCVSVQCRLARKWPIIYWKKYTLLFFIFF